MGSYNSRLGSPPPPPPPPATPTLNPTNRFALSSLLCGASTTVPSTSQMEEHPTELQEESATEIDDEIRKVAEEPSCTEARISCDPHTETTTSFDTIANITVEGSSRNVATSSQRPCLLEGMELVPPPLVTADHSHHASYRDSSNTASASSVQQQSSNPVSVDVSANKDAVNNIGTSVDSGDSQISHETMHQELGDSNSGESFMANHPSAFIAFQSPVSSPVAEDSNLPVTYQLPENVPSRRTIPSGLGILVSNRETGQGNGSVLHIDVVAISSNFLFGSNSSDSNHDARRSSRRLFWDAFSQRNSRRFGDSPTSPTTVSSTGDADDPGSQNQWPGDLGDDFSNDRVGGDSGYVGSIIHRLNERRQQSRSEIWERLRSGLDEIGHSNSSCPLGLHADGMCSCESSPMDEESSTRARISRIVMLAEALFEILDEIHRQPLLLSLSMVSIPAPESVVDAFPLKTHKKVDDGTNEAEKCYICLAEYEEGDQIRVLPCNHEYHMLCVDKWLKEINGVCPLCRGNVCRGFSESSASNTEVPSR